MAPFTAAAGPVLAVDLGATQIRAAVVTPDGHLITRADGPTRSADGPAAVIGDVVALLGQVRDAAPRSVSAGLVGIGICTPGPVDPRTGRLVEPPNLGPAFRDLPFAEPIGAAMGLPAVLDRDTNVALLGELGFGAARGAGDVLYITVSTGCGGAIASGGRLVTGPDGVAGEIGHIAVDFDGPMCGCGARGHLEAYSSGVGIVRAARELIGLTGAFGSAATDGPADASGLADLDRRLHAERGSGLSAKDIADAEEAGDPAARQVMETARHAFASALVGLVNLFAPELIVVGGSIARGQGERWLEPARAEVERVGFRIPAARVKIVPAALGDDVGLVGAVGLVGLRLGDATASA